MENKIEISGFADGIRWIRFKDTDRSYKKIGYLSY